jgi:hypothetical protein
VHIITLVPMTLVSCWVLVLPSLFYTPTLSSTITTDGMPSGPSPVCCPSTTTQCSRPGAGGRGCHRIRLLLSPVVARPVGEWVQGGLLAHGCQWREGSWCMPTLFLSPIRPMPLCHHYDIARHDRPVPAKGWNEVGPDHPFLSVRTQVPLRPCLAVVLAP